MDERKAELKQLKKACKKAKRKHVTLWKSLGILFLVFAIILSAASVVVKMFDNTMAAMMGGKFWDVINEDPDAQYFKQDFASNEERLDAGAQI